MHYGIDHKNVIWLSGDVSLEKNAKGSILDNKSFVYWEGHILEHIKEHVKEKLNLICNNCDRAGINSLGWTLNKTIEHQTFRQMKKFPKIKT